MSDSGWLMYHSVGRFPGQSEAVAAALGQAAADWCAVDDRRWGAYGAGRQRFLDGIARLFNAAPGSILAAENVTAAFGQFIEALPAARLAGQRVLIAADCFPSLHYLLTELAARRGFTLVTVPPAPGAVSVTEADMIAAWDERVALGIVTWVTSTASRRSDVATLADHGRRMGSLVAVDVTQALGIIPFDVQALGIDFAASTALKWLCGLPGAGFGYVRPGLLPSLEPRLHGWFSRPDPFDWRLDNFSLAPDARRFDTGTPSYLPYLGSLPGLEWLLASGIAALRERNLALSADLIATAQAHGLRVVSPLDPEHRGGSVMVELPTSLPAPEMVATLARDGLIADHRGPILRLSPGPSTGGDVAARLDHVLRSTHRRAA